MFDEVNGFDTPCDFLVVATYRLGKWFAWDTIYSTWSQVHVEIDWDKEAASLPHK